MMDPLSEVLRSVRLTGGVFLDVRMSAPWSVISEVTAGDVTAFLAKPAQIISFHVLLTGRCLLTVGDDRPLEVAAGEIVLMPRNDLHMLSSAVGLKPVDGRSLVQPSPDGGLARVVYGGGGEPAHLVCGFLGSEQAGNPLLSTLPKALKLDLRQGTSRDWVEASVRFAAGELAEGRLASSSVMSRLSEVLLVEAVRQYASTLHEGETGWLAGLSDPYVGRALALIHHDIGGPWTTEMLAERVALSRSAFTERFATKVGMPPIRYLTHWRLQTAKLHLRETKKSVSQIANAVGYDSEEAFSRAFKREFSLSPAHWREQFISTSG